MLDLENDDGFTLPLLKVLQEGCRDWRESRADADRED